jgi:O-antigen ligase
MISELKSTKGILIGLICLLYVGLFFPIHISNITIIGILLFCLIKTPPKDFLETLKRNVFSKIMTSFYFLYIIGLLYTSNYKVGLFVLEKKITLLLFPLLLLPLFQRVDIGKSIVYKIIGYITILSSIVLIVIAGYKTVILQNTQAFYFENFTTPLLPYVYYSIYFAVGSLFLLESLFEQMIKWKYGVFILFILFIYSISFLILVASKTGILAYAFTSIILLYKKIENGKIITIFLAVLIISSSTVLYFNDTTRGRFTELSQNLSILTRDELGDWQEETLTGLNMRLLFWKISIVNSWKDNLVLIGNGTGDAQDYLDSLYTNPKYNREGYVGWDSHNEWIFTYLQIGIIGVFMMGFLYAYLFRRAHITNDIKLLSFLLVTLAFSMSESILESNKGIVFFALMTTLLSSSPDNKLRSTY